jgi:hypothetical protein
MAHFAEIDKNNIVTRVLVTDNDFPNEGHDWLIETFGGRWIQTSYNGKIRKNFAGVGFVYDELKDAFIPPKPFDSWILDEKTCWWKSPVDYPIDGKNYNWDEDSQKWIEVEND